MHFAAAPQTVNETSKGEMTSSDFSWLYIMFLCGPSGKLLGFFSKTSFFHSFRIQHRDCNVADSQKGGSNKHLGYKTKTFKAIPTRTKVVCLKVSSQVNTCNVGYLL